MKDFLYDILSTDTSIPLTDIINIEVISTLGVDQMDIATKLTEHKNNNKKLLLPDGKEYVAMAVIEPTYINRRHASIGIGASVHLSREYITNTRARLMTKNN